MSETRQLKVVIAGDVKSARQALKVLGTGLDQADREAEKAGKSVDRFNAKVENLAQHAGFALAGLAVAAAGLGIAFAKGLEFDQAQAKFAAQMGPEHAEHLGKVAGELYTSGFGETMADNFEAIRKVTSSGLIPADAATADIERITGKAMNLAKVFDQDVTQTARAAGQMVKTGLAKNADEAMDMLTRGFQVTGDHAGDLLDTVTEYGTQFRNVGLDGAAAMGLISQGLKAGARDTDVVADTIKEFSIEAVAGSAKIRKGYQSLGLDADKMFKAIGKGGPDAAKALDTTLDSLRAVEDPVKRNAIAVELFGTKAEDLGQALYALDPSEAAKGLGEVGGAADKMGKTLKQSASAQLEMFRRKVETAIVQKMAAAIPTIISFGQWMARNQEWLGPVAVGLGTLAGAIAVLTIAAKVYTMVQAALNVVMMANPVGLVVLAIIALVAAIVYAWRNSETFRRVVTGAWNAVKAAVMAVVNWFRVEVPKAWAAVVAFTKTYWNFWKSIIVGVVNFIKGFYVGAFNFYKSLILGAWNAIKSGTRSAWNAIKGFITGAINGAKAVVSKVSGAIRSALSSAWNAAKSLTSSAWNAWVSLIRSAIGKAIGLVKGIRSKVIGALSGAASWLKASGQKIIEGLISGIRGMAGRVKDAIGDVLQGARNLLPFSPAKEGPFSGKGWTYYSGQSIPEALAAGIRKRTGLVVKATHGMMSGAHTNVSAGLASRSVAARQAAGINVSVHVGGHVTAERDLAKAIAGTVRDEIARTGKRNGGRTGL